MKFKKDYINFLLRKVIYLPENDFKENLLLKKVADKIISIDDVGKITFLVGKTAGLESLFKYLLYISDKIDKSQISIFNLKDNISYDIDNLAKICSAIRDYKSVLPEADDIEKKSSIKIDVTPGGDSEIEKISKETYEMEETEPDVQDSGMTLIENVDSKTGEGEVFELENLSETVENTGSIKENDSGEDVTVTREEEYSEEEEQSVLSSTDREQESGIMDERTHDLIEQEEIEEGTEVKDSDTIEAAFTDAEEMSGGEIAEQEAYEKADEGSKEETEDVSYAEEREIKEEPAVIEPEIEIEVVKPAKSSDSYKAVEEQSKEESVPNEAYYKFETKFFEEVKILEKLLATVDKEFKAKDRGKLSERSIQSLAEIVEITSELSNLSRQLMFDLIADVFLTMNLYFTKVISTPEIFDSEKNMLFDSSLALVNSLIKGEDYLNYDIIIDKIEKLKFQLTGSGEQEYQEEVILKQSSETAIEEKTEAEETEAAGPVQVEVIQSNPEEGEDKAEIFKLKYLVKEFEKSFAGISSIKGDYSRFEALEKINELNNALRLIAKISSATMQNDVLKLAEVTYVFLKYLKDYRIDLQDAEIQQIIKYIIFTFKMLLTNRKPDDFEVLVQHLNNPVKIFTDS